MTQHSRFEVASTDLRGTRLIEASAGTGKTFAITSIVSRLIGELGLGIDRILIVTFTEAATAELRDRVRSRLTNDAASAEPAAQKRYESALRDFDEAAIFTIHGFCKRILDEHAFESDVSYDLELVPDLSEMCREVVTDDWADRLYGADPLLVRCLELEKVSIEELMSLVLTVAAQPYRRILPGATSSGLDPLEEFCEAFACAAQIWRGRREEILEKLDGAWDDLNRNSYSLKLKQRKAQLLDSLFGGDVPADVALDKDLEKFASPCLEARTKKSRRPPLDPFFDACARLCSARAQLKEVAVRFRMDAVGSCLRRMEERKAKAGVQSFDDLLLRMRSALQSPRGAALAQVVRARFHAVLIDEFQDTDPVQYEVFSRIYGETTLPLFLIGDPKQSIYGFRGADIFTYLDAVRDAGDDVFGLDTNWRSDPGLVRGAQALFAKSQRPFVLPGISYPHVKSREGAEDALRCGGKKAPPLRLGFVSCEDVEEGALQKNKQAIKKTEAVPLVADFIAGRIVTLLGQGYALEVGATRRFIEKADIAVLVRSNRQAELVRDALTKRRVKAVCYGQKGVFESAEAEELLTVLTAVAHTASSEKLRAALATEALGLTGDQIEALATDEPSWDRWVERFGQWSALWRSRGVEATLRRILEENTDGGSETVAAQMLARAGGERRLTNWRHLMELLGEVEARDHLGPLGVIRELERHMVHEKSEQGALVRMESDEMAVKILTVHKSKGLEFPVVLCPYLWESALERPSSRKPMAFHEDDGGAVLDIGSKDRERHRRRVDDEALAEGMRLAYVAVTRARHMCEVVLGPFSGVETSPLAYALCADDSVHTAAQLAEHMKSEGAEALHLGAERLAQAAPGDVAVYRLGPHSGLHERTGERTEARLRKKELRAFCPQPERTESFSSLIMSAEHHAGEVLEGELDELDLSAKADKKNVPSAQRLALADFPRGPRAGTCLHAIFERWRPGLPSEETLAALVAEQLARHGFDARTWTGPVTRNVEDVLAARLREPDGPRLEDVAATDRLVEMEFVFPLGRSSRLTPKALRECFSRANCAVSKSYASAAGRLSFGRLSGFLKGYIDLVLRHEGRYYLLDYKSNDLGPTRDDYSDEDLVEAMVAGHYMLQEHLYTVALHRYLSVRLSGYDYETHFGGAFYLFLRGMEGPAGQTAGVFCHRPSAAVIHELDELLGGKLP